MKRYRLVWTHSGQVVERSVELQGRDQLDGAFAAARAMAGTGVQLWDGGRLVRGTERTWTRRPAAQRELAIESGEAAERGW